MSHLPGQTLYKTQIRELKEECDDKKKLCKDLRQRVAEYEEERLVGGAFLIHPLIPAVCAREKRNAQPERSFTPPTVARAWDDAETKVIKV